MRTHWSRARASLGLLVAIFSDLRRRAWWLGQSRALENMPHSTTVVAPRRVEQQMTVPAVGSLWRPVVDHALPVRAISMLRGTHGNMVPIIVLDVAERPEIADLPRVLATEVTAENPAIVGANWLADPSVSQAVLVVTFVEPVTCTWAIGFDLPRCQTLLEQVAEGHELYVGWHVDFAEGLKPENATSAVSNGISPPGLLLRVGRPDHLRAILQGWTTEHEWS